MTLEVFGYSERGMINTIVHEMQYGPHGMSMLRDFLGLATFPFETSGPCFQNIESATIIIEQSFSDFGDLDVLFLLNDASGRKHSLFLEAKVKTRQKGDWLIQDEWAKFLGAVRRPAGNPASNLFVQLYRKLQLVRHALGQSPAADAISSLWRIGTNSVVLKATRLLKPYAADTRFLSLVPDSTDNVRRFFSDTVAGFSPASAALPAWNHQHWGYLTWSQVETLCRQKPANWSHSLANFDYNLGQIFAAGSVVQDPNGRETLQPPPLGYTPRLRDICQVGGRQIVIAKTGNNNHRYRFLVNGVVDPISESLLASTSELSPTGERYHGQIQPIVGEHYLYQNREVVVVGGGPEKSRVKWAGASSSSFLVLDHHLRRIA